MKMSEENKKKVHNLLDLCIEFNEKQEDFEADFQYLPYIEGVTIYVRQKDKGYEEAERIAVYINKNYVGYKIDEAISRLRQIINYFDNVDKIQNNILKAGSEEDENRI